MSEMLNNDQIAALVDAAKKGQLPEQTASAGNRRGPRLRTVDFSRPTKFTTDHQRRIARAIDAFCQTAVAHSACFCTIGQSRRGRRPLRRLCRRNESRTAPYTSFWRW